MPSSRPKPDCLKPPNGVETRTELFELMLSTPVSSARATRSARRAVLASRSSRRGRRACRSRSGSRPPRRRTGSARRPARRPLRARSRSSFVASTIVHGYQKPLPFGRARPEERLAVDEARDGLAVLRGDQRAHLGRVVARVADLDVAGRRRRAARRSGRRRCARRGSASARSSPGPRCRRRRTARRPRPSRGRRRRRRRSRTCRRARA